MKTVNVVKTDSCTWHFTIVKKHRHHSSLYCRTRLSHTKIYRGFTTVLIVIAALNEWNQIISPGNNIKWTHTSVLYFQYTSYKLYNLNILHQFSLNWYDVKWSKIFPPLILRSIICGCATFRCPLLVNKSHKNNTVIIAYQFLKIKICF